MHRSKPHFGTLALLGIGIFGLVGGASILQAQQAQKSTTALATPLGVVYLSGYQKISGNLANGSLHLAGPAVTLTLTAPTRAKRSGVQHCLRADDILVRKENNGLSADLSGNVRYALLQSPNGGKVVEGTADHAFYRQSGGKEDAAVILDQFHADLFQNGNAVAGLTAKQVTALHDGAVLGTGDVQITAMIASHRATLTADKIIWDRHANTVVASGNAQITYAGQDGKESSTRANRITFNLASKKFEIE